MDQKGTRSPIVDKAPLKHSPPTLKFQKSSAPRNIPLQNFRKLATSLSKFPYYQGRDSYREVHPKETFSK